MTVNALASVVIAFVLALLASPVEGGQADLATELERVATGHHRDPASLVRLRDTLEGTVGTEPQLEQLLALARLWFITGDRASGPEAKRDAYGRARRYARRAGDLEPTNAVAHFWYRGRRAAPGRAALRSHLPARLFDRREGHPALGPRSRHGRRPEERRGALAGAGF